MKRDIEGREDIELLVNHFYEKVRQDDLLSPVFEQVVQGNWTPHLEKMYNFWETICFNVHKYNGSPFQKHIPLAIDATHFERWLHLFHQTLDSFFSGAIAEEVKKRSTQMGTMFQFKLAHIKNTNNQGNN
jgi:hemoglobin